MTGRTIGLAAFAAVMISFILAPLLVIVAGSFTPDLYLTFPPRALSLHWYERLSNDPRWAVAAWNTVRIGLPVAVLATGLGTCAALAVARSDTRTLRGIGILLVAPMMLPHIIIAIGLYPIILRLGLSGTYAAVVIGHTVIAMPLAFLTVSASLGGYPASLELAAATLGANPSRVFLRVTLPMIRTGMAIGGLLAFVTSFDELMLSLFLTAPRTETLPRLIWEHLFFTLTPEVAAVASSIIAVSILLLAASLLLGRGKVDLVGLREGGTP